MSYDIHTSVEHCKKCVGKQPEVVMFLAKSALVQCRRCQTIHPGDSFPRKLLSIREPDEV